AQGASIDSLKGILLATGTLLQNQQAYLRTDSIINAYSALQAVGSPRPVITINGLKLNDVESQWHNEVIDPGETFSIELSLQNLWDDANNVQLTLVSENPLLQPITNTATISYWQKNTDQSVNFQFNSQNFNGQQQFPFVLNIAAGGSMQSASYQRRFQLNSGVLAHNQPQQDTIQRNFADETRAWHFNIPADAKKVAIELEKLDSDDRKLGLLASKDQKPLLYFKSQGVKPYTSLADFEIFSDNSYERLDFNVPDLRDETIHLVVFNQPANITNENVKTNKNYRVKACYFSDNDSNQAPTVNAGLDRKVKAGEEVILEGSVSDSDGNIVKSWWSSPTNIDFTVLSNNKISFTAPESGPVSFVLTATDNDCAKTSDTVTIDIEESQSNRTGLQITPGRIVVAEGSVVSMQITASYEQTPVTDLRFISGPDGLVYQKAQGQNSFDQIIWQNTGKPGLYLVLFSANVNGSIYEGKVTIEVTNRSGKTTGGGCTTASTTEFDPLFMFYLLFSFVYLQKRQGKV
ncbi:MAG: hypothetical protein R3240_09715, partial [Gammaproteobacteria bacterium]|nr:hypothetical protein [Gammaproteobacteria bacterium]